MRLEDGHRFTADDALLNDVNQRYLSQWKEMDREQQIAIRIALGFVPQCRETITGQRARKMLESLGVKVQSKRIPKTGDRYLVLSKEG